MALVSHELDRGLGYELRVVAMSDDSPLVGNDPSALELALHVRIPQCPLRISTTIKLGIAELFRLPVMIRHDWLSLEIPRTNFHEPISKNQFPRTKAK
jgi:hypothetical protein